jgi:CspA family cold shock protein
LAYGCGVVPSTALGAAKEAAVMASGTVKWFDPNRGHGFIQPEQGEDVFVHISAVQASGLQILQDGQAVEFDIEQGRRGSPGRQRATTADTRVGLTRRSRLPPG